MARPAVEAVRVVASLGGGPIGGGWSAHFLARGYDVVAYLHDPAEEPVFRSVVDAVLTGSEVVVPVVAVVDTITDAHGVTVDREALRSVQTPQGFRADVLRTVHASRPEATDDASLVVAAGGRLRHVQGERWNLKVTEPDDLVVAEALLEQR